jgi:hypothetical protein
MANLPARQALARRPRQSESGMATIESLPILIVFLVIASYAIGSFGAIHTAILHSIAARTYAYETFRHRSNLVYFRDNSDIPTNFFNYLAVGARVHGIGSPEHAALSNRFYATERPLAKGLEGPDVEGRDQATHNVQVLGMPAGGAAMVGVSPLWIMIDYGICLNAACAGQ